MLEVLKKEVCEIAKRAQKDDYVNINQEILVQEMKKQDML